MTCHEARDLYSALVDDALDASERGALEVHLAGCAECRRELERFRGTVGLFQAAPAVRAPAGFVDRVLAAARPTPWHRRLRERLFSPLRVKLPLEAAAVLLVAGIAVYVFQHTPELQQAARHEAPPSAPAQAPASDSARAPRERAPTFSERAPIAPAPTEPVPLARRDAAPDAARRAAPAEAPRSAVPASEAPPATAPAAPRAPDQRAPVPAVPAPPGRPGAARSAPPAIGQAEAPPAGPPAFGQSEASRAAPSATGESEAPRAAPPPPTRPATSPPAPPETAQSEVSPGARSKSVQPGAPPGAMTAPPPATGPSAAPPEIAKKSAVPPPTGRNATDAAKDRTTLERRPAEPSAPKRDRILPSVLSESQQADRQGALSAREEKMAAAPAVPPPAPSAPASPAPPTPRPAMKSAPGEAPAGAQRQSASAPRAQEDQARVLPSPSASDVSGLLTVADREATLRGLDDLIARAGAHALASRADGEMAVVEVIVPREAYADFIQGLSRLGRFIADREPGTLPAQVRLTLRIGS